MVETVNRDSKKVAAEWEKWLSRNNREELASGRNDFDATEKFSSVKEWAIDFSTHPHGGCKASKLEAAKYLYAYMDDLKKWEKSPLHAKNSLCLLASWGLTVDHI